ncbi:hypothetical protein J27TS8_22640 [Robertmurraya siralis]|uniref:Activator of Hsp90 ATPase homologue 1/2-like C-terminal domain-containing protein n=1 Tax=Robertmurraya siralis TaxID=77777 RepID=A0A920BU56_9BACI|nr:SRPBCC domain-containing protein [Robertmurraya siralis]PAE20332.1 hypothetical protein CHH80_12115 [Bacillus sp. 7504-2]GIN62271.1 hypothetical protein J27TS8_22640 [Robertmurraya siralis]
MTAELIVRDEVLIDAPPAKVWKVLITPKYVAQWDELPEDYPSEDMSKGSEVVWEHNGEKTITTIIKAEEMKELQIALYQSNWEVQPDEGDVAYRYNLEERNGSTLLKIEIGDFSLIENGQMYYDASVEFASNSKHVIKGLAESL